MLTRLVSACWLLGAGWVCPCCRDLCNCSRHRKLRKWEATGQLHRSVKSRGEAQLLPLCVCERLQVWCASRACHPDLPLAGFVCLVAAGRPRFLPQKRCFALSLPFPQATCLSLTTLS
jgi:hypothetical protein